MAGLDIETVRSVGAAGEAWHLPGGAQVRCTDAADGDLSDSRTGSRSERDATRRHIVDLPWATVRQVHGCGVVGVERPGDADGSEGDALVSSQRGVALAVRTADCAPVAFASPEGVIGVAHAGWRGLSSGVVEATVAAMRARGASRVRAVLGPCIHPSCYSFSSPDLEAVAAEMGPSVRGTDAAGGPALDLPAAVGVAVARAGATLVDSSPTCTACSDRHWSWRARGDRQRQATVVWRP
ncbi:MAG: polyphenol oxidase family protein [Acidimicrobiales bacterium]